MKRHIIAALALFIAAVTSFAQLPTSGDWNGTDDGGKSRRVTASQNVRLEGDVNLKCTIIVGNGKTLTINGAGYHIYNKVRTDGRSGGMFKVEAGGRLIINGAENSRINIDGGGKYATPTYDSDLMSGGIIDNVDALVTESGSTTIEMGAPAIYNLGVVELNYVTIQNVCNTTTPASGEGTTGKAATSGGAIVHGSTATGTTMNHCLVNQILANSGAGVYVVTKSDGEVVISDTEFKNCVNYTQASGLHGGVIRGWGDSKANITLTKVKIHHSYSAADAGAIYFPSNGINTGTGKQAVLTLNECEFYNNCANLRGGALDICANLNLTGATTKVHHNYVQNQGTGSAAGNGAGGGISFRGYDSNSGPSTPVNVEYNANNLLEVYGNKSFRGAGIAFYASSSISLVDGTTFTLNVNGAKIYSNEATYGGGIWMRNDWVKVESDEKKNKDFTFTLNLNSGDIYSNTALYGGGLFINKWKVASSPTGSIKVRMNKAIKPDDSGGLGGAIYLEGQADYVMESGTIGGSSADKNEAANYGGGIYLTGSSEFKFKAGEVSYNYAKSSGGGIMLTGSSSATFSGGDITHNKSNSLGGGVAIYSGSTFTFSNGNIKFNRAEDSGGGIYCNASTLKFDNGECSNNTAEGSGGGLCILKGGVVTFKGNIKNNSAVRGGGVSLNTGSSFTMTGGIISGNEATIDDDDVSGAAKTTYNARNDGFGGGIFVFNNDASTPTTTLVIDISEGSEFGLYGNEASIGGNDITSSGVRTSVTIPNVKSMELAGFAYKDASPNWYEDYNAADANYDKGTNLDAATNARYADQLTANTYLKHLVSFTGNSNTYTNYLNLTLGYELLHIIITVKNLIEGESAMFRLSYNDGERSWPVVLTGNGDATVSKTIRNLNYGLYEAKPVSWQWNYDVSPADGYSDNISVGPEKEYQFELTRKDLPLKTAEEQVVNEMKKPGI